MKKIWISILSAIMLFTGCTVNYEINIDNSVDEIITISQNKENITADIYGGVFTTSFPYKERIDSIIELPQSVLKNQDIDIYDPTNELQGTLYYNKILVNSDTSYGVKLNSTIELDQIKFLNSVSHCYKDFDVLLSSSRLVISTSKENLCFDTYSILDELTIKIKTKYKVINSNAMDVDSDTYIWNLNRENYNNQNIHIEIDLSQSNKSLRKLPLYATILIAFGVVIVIGGLVYIFVKIVGNKNNKL